MGWIYHDFYGSQLGQSRNNLFYFHRCGDKEFMENMIKKVALVRDFNPKGQGLWVSMEILQGDLKQVKNTKLEHNGNVSNKHYSNNVYICCQD